MFSFKNKSNIPKFTKEEVKNDVRKRILIYESLLFRYRKAKRSPRLSDYLETKLGMCYPIHGKDYSICDLDELADEDPHNYGSAYWFKTGLLEPRIVVLERALEWAVYRESKILRTSEERLKIYRRSLMRYRLSRISNYKTRRNKFDTHLGLCYHLSYKENVKSATQYMHELKELCPLGVFDYWFDPGKLLPRIKVLKDAIRLVKLTIKEEKIQRIRHERTDNRS